MLHNGQVVKTWQGAEAAVLSVKHAGAYRVEAFIDYENERRTWIISNPIFVEA
jgi:hypothetical protein